MTPVTHNNAHIMRNIQLFEEKVARLFRAEAGAKKRLKAASEAADKARAQVDTLWRERTLAEFQFDQAQAQLTYCELSDEQLFDALAAAKELTRNTCEQMDELRKQNVQANERYSAIENLIKWRENCARKQEEVRYE